MCQLLVCCVVHNITMKLLNCMFYNVMEPNQKRRTKKGKKGKKKNEKK